MAEITSYAPGTPSWVDLGTTDLEGTIAFYSGLFGWEINIGDPETGRYSMAMLADQPVAGLADQQQPGVPPRWTTYLTTADVDATVAAVGPAGGTVVMSPMDVLDAGRMAIALDAGGATIAFWQPRDHIGAGRVNEPGTVCWNELTTRAVEESTAFYAQVAGMTDHPVDMGGTQYHELQIDGRTVAGLMPMVGDEWGDLPSHWMVYFAVDDTDAAAARATELGGGVSVPPTDIPPGRFSVITDPQGGFFSVLTLTNPPG